MAAWPGGINAITLSVEDVAAAKKFWRSARPRPIYWSFKDPGGHIWEIAK